MDSVTISLESVNSPLHISSKVHWRVPGGQQARIVQIDLSAAFDRVNHHDILYKQWSVGIGGSVLSLLTQFPSNRSHHVMVDGCRSKQVNVNCVRIAVRRYFRHVIVPPVNFGALFPSGE